MFVNGKQNGFITLKDHKLNFQNNATVRLLNPAKNELVRISKNILDKINVNPHNSLHYNQWKNTQEGSKALTINNIIRLSCLTSKVFTRQFLQFLTNVLAFAETMINLDDHDKKIIYHSRKSLLFNQEQTWMKKGSDLFDVSMGASDGREVCELIGIFLLNLLRRQYDTKNIGLYRYDKH